jgi:hypothetical protein
MKQNGACHVQNIHGCAINCVILSLLIQQLILLFFNTVRASGQESGLLPPRSAFSRCYQPEFRIRIGFNADPKPAF